MSIVFRPGNRFTHRGGRDTRDPRREEGGYSLQYSTDEQRRMSRCVARRMRSYFRDGTLGNYATFGITLLLLSSCISTQKNLPEFAETQAENDSTKPSQSSGMVPQRSYEETAGRKYGGDVDFHINEPGTHVLCIKRPRRTPKPVPVLTSRTKFFVFDLSKSEILFEDSLENARVFWEDETHVKILVTPGIVQGVVPKEYGYLYDVVSGRKELLGTQ